MMLPIRYNIRSLAVRKATVSATVLGVALVTLVLASSLMLAEGARRTVSMSSRQDTAVVLRKGSDNELSSSIEDTAVALLGAAPGIQRQEGRPLVAAETVVVLALPKLGTSGFSNILLRGVREDSLRMHPELHIVEGRLPQPGGDEAMVGVRIRGRFGGLSVGESFELRKNRLVKIVGVFASEGSSSESEVWADNDLVRAAFGRLGAVSSVRVRLEAPESFGAFQSAIEQDKRLGLMTMLEPAFLERQSEGLSLFIRVLGIVIALFFSIGAIVGATITMHGAVASRRREIGTLRALGFSRRSVLLGFLFESLLLAAVGGVLGSLMSMALSWVKISMVNYATWSELVFTFTATPRILVSSVLFASVLGALGGFFPALRASKISPLAALRA